MFLFGKKKKDSPAPGWVLAPMNAQALPLEQMPDEVFAERVLGDGVCLLPEDGRVCSPVDGRVDNIADALHAFGLVAADGAEILVHIGVDTVGLGGKPFAPAVRAGQSVKRGQLLCTVDLAQVRAAGLPVHTAVLLTNTDTFAVQETRQGQMRVGESELFRYARR